MKHKDDGVTQFNFVKNEWVKPEYRTDDDGPSQAWIDGWESARHNGLNVCPYDPCSQEGVDWFDGREAYERD